MTPERALTIIILGAFAVLAVLLVLKVAGAPW